MSFYIVSIKQTKPFRWFQINPMSFVCFEEILRPLSRLAVILYGQKKSSLMPQFVAHVGTLFEIRTQENDTRPEEYLREKGEKEHNIVWRRSSIPRSNCGCNTDAIQQKSSKIKRVLCQKDGDVSFQNKSLATSFH